MIFLVSEQLSRPQQKGQAYDAYMLALQAKLASIAVSLVIHSYLLNCSSHKS